MYLFRLFMTLALFAGMPVKVSTKWVVEKSSSLSISGRTNINRFACGVAEYAQSDTIVFLGEKCRGSLPGITLGGALRLNIVDFDCNNRMMTGEFKKTLQYQKYPQLKISFLSLERMPLFGHEPEDIRGWVEIGLAGTSRRFEIDYRSSRRDAATVMLTGSRSLGFSDFGLEAPRKMGGLVKVSDELNVSFILSLRQAE